MGLQRVGHRSRPGDIERWITARTGTLPPPKRCVIHASIRA